MSIHFQSSEPSLPDTVPRDLQVAVGDVTGLFVGPMPVKSFLDEFLPARPGRPLGKSAFLRLLDFSCPLESMSKENLVSKLVKGVASLLPSWLVAETPQRDAACQLGVDIGLYNKSHTPPLAADFSQLQLFINVDPQVSCDPFDDSRPPPPARFPFERHTVEALQTKARESSCVGAMSGLQSRLHTFSVLISGSSARLLRWDASGVLVTKSFSYTQTEYLLDFLWRFDALSPLQRGLDSSIHPVEEEWPIELAPRHVLEDLKSRNTAKTGPSCHRCFAIMKIPDRDEPATEHDLIVSWPPRYSKTSPVGRGTRPLFAYDINSRKLVFVKQYWRVDGEGQKEGEVYRLLTSKGVRHLPNFGRGNDVRGYTTATHRFNASQKRKSWHRNTRPLVPYRLYRMSLDTIGAPITTFKTARQLVEALRDVMICHDDAFFEAGILHADISASNIMIDPRDGSGLLTDWDCCIDTNNVGTGKIPRRGTWQFMSTGLLRGFQSSHTLADDRESILWVFMWLVLHHIPFESESPLETWLEMFEERHSHASSQDTGGYLKAKFLASLDILDSLFSPTTSGIHHVITSLRLLLRVRCTPAPLNPNLPFYQMLVDAGQSVHGPEVYEEDQKSLAELSARGAIVQLLNKSLDNPARWPQVDNAAVPDDNTRRTSASRKRTSDDAGLPDLPRITKAARRSTPPPVPSSASPPLNTPRPLVRRRKAVVPPSDRVLRPRPSQTTHTPVETGKPSRPTRKTPAARTTDTLAHKPSVAPKARRARKRSS